MHNENECENPLGVKRTARGMRCRSEYLNAIAPAALADDAIALPVMFGRGFQAE
jgi:hypothetical protein